MAFLNDRNSNLSDPRRSRRFDQMRFDEDDDGFFGGDDGDDFEGDDSLDICAPIQCNEDDDGPDFSRMVKK